MSGLDIKPITEMEVPGFLELIRTHLADIALELWDKRWFDWKFRQNPWVSRPAAVVAVDDGEVVGGAGFVPVPMAFEESQFLAIQPTDVVIHPDYRSGRTFSRLIDIGLETFADSETWLTYGQPRADTVEVWTRLRGWTDVKTVPRSWRINRPHTFVSDVTEKDNLSKLSMATYPVFLGANIIERIVRDSPADSTRISRYDKVPSSLLQNLWESGSPAGVHIRRTDAFYNWRLSDAPHAAYTTFVALHGDEIVGALITSRWRSHDIVKIVELLPLDLSVQSAREVVRNLVVAALKSHSDRGAIRASPALPAEIISEFGFTHTQYMKKLTRFGPVERLTADVVPSWELHFAGKVLEHAKFSDEAAKRVVNWSEWAFTGIEIDTA